jgi:rSAM/selenodomain-associated transferase 1
VDREGDRLVVFARCPVAGQVKTRLAARIGDEPAAALYEAFLRDLVLRFRGAPFAVRWAVAPPEDGFADRFGLPASACFEQSGADLGARMHSAFREALAAGARRCVVIGSDMPQLRVEVVEEAFERLATTDLVLGPAEDGGYYLIALREAHDVFHGVAWSSAAVLDETLRRADALGLSVGLLERGFDVDEPEDIERLRRFLAERGSEECAETARVLERVLAPSA